MFSVTVITTMTKRKGPGEERSYLAHITQPQSTIKGNKGRDSRKESGSRT